MDIFSQIKTHNDFDISHIINPKIISTNNRSILQEAIVWNPDLALKMVDLDININHQDNEGAMALQYALSRSYYKLVKKILQKEPDVNLLDRHGNNALWTACLNPKKDYDVIKTLVQMGTNIHHKNKYGRSVLDFAIQSDNQKLMELFEK